jgi:hypothetical protein
VPAEFVEQRKERKTMTDIATQAYDRIVALKELSQTAKIQTYKSQSEILKSLNPTDLADVALALKAGR